MDSTVDVLSEQPWGQTYWEWHDGYTMGWGRRGPEETINFQAQFKLIPDRKGNYWSRGDLVKFGPGFYNWRFDHEWPWKKWFMPEKDYLNALENSPFAHIDKRVPMYARLQYGIILSRYKWIKDKGYKVFYDYGSIIMTLTGSKPGRIRRYYLKTPYELISRYPYDHIIPYHKQMGTGVIPEGVRIQEAMNYAKTKDQFILNMIDSFHDSNYPEKMERQNESKRRNYPL